MGRSTVLCDLSNSYLPLKRFDYFPQLLFGSLLNYHFLTFERGILVLVPFSRTKTVKIINMTSKIGPINPSLLFIFRRSNLSLFILKQISIYCIGIYIYLLGFLKCLTFSIIYPSRSNVLRSNYMFSVNIRYMIVTYQFVVVLIISLFLLQPLFPSYSGQVTFGTLQQLSLISGFTCLSVKSKHLTL